MADGEHTLKLEVTLSEGAARRLRERAADAGLSIDDYAAGLIEDATPGDWAEAEAALAEYDRTGEHTPLREGLAVFRHAVDSGLTARGGKSRRT